MKLSLLTLIIVISTLSFSTAQSDSLPIVKPILMDKAVLSGVGLRKINLKDEPEKDFYQKNLFRGEDISVYVVSTETWNNKIPAYAFDEYVYLINGQSIVKPRHGNAKVYDSGDHLFVPKGFDGEWEIRAGSNLHYELSVITTRRAAPTELTKKMKQKDLVVLYFPEDKLLLKKENIKTFFMKEKN